MSSDSDIKQESVRLFSELKNVSLRKNVKWTLEDCEKIAPYTLEINKLKKEKDAVILAHSYTNPEIMYGVADTIGDSYALSMEASRVKAKTIIFAGVWFMAETAKIINPSKNIYIPAGHAGCTLADSMTGEDLSKFKEKYPGVPVICYINSSADVKAYSDVCVTSANVYDIAAKMPGDKLIFVPDVLMADNLQAELKRRGVRKEIVSTGGSCCVHDKYTEQDVEHLRSEYPGIKVMIHPEARIEICRLCDYVGGTGGMLKYVAESKDKTLGLLTEVGLVNRLEHDNPDKKFIWNKGTCAYMKRNTLLNTLSALQNPSSAQTVVVEENICNRASECIEKMFKMTDR
ncbi:Quinolinate synthetase complex, A subunit [Elusimicrobium minutum Pei191]|uniref:Quinolinate synthase n=1 Tax=Elusimicrobium minutum (strain Pei191) TaxID=445932 RepID=B2KBF4_ELUMP|nr:quinolinate synthase NadA [Elusimicrobium minutum]ACC97976.1 Quinolinate synthetase complex, A subunit [Elusimicrobium minutum Pei191]